MLNIPRARKALKSLRSVASLHTVRDALRMTGHPYPFPVVGTTPCDTFSPDARMLSLWGESNGAGPVREPQGEYYISIRSLDAPEIELQRIPIPFDTRARYHDEVCPRLSSNGRFLSICPGAGLGTAVYDLESPSEPHMFPRAEEIRGLDFSSDARLMAIVERTSEAPGYQLQLYELPSFSRIASMASQGGRYLQFSPDGDFVAVSGKREVTIHEVPSGHVAATIPLPEDDLHHALGWSASGALLATSTQDEIWMKRCW